ncbi:hypothetical protein MIND_00199400 [Mycena indigotica]|uniref:F-box domain-containing protein n=1 Tax=Mycena indigotica TaxID=2126181 RepID=A0A8H6T4E7_9AGAR|nr:uncharacterized protein MIND_00199400 [Mycena indigotica]KAF7311885.1 hypothetical protein MIND_00199400 [Mycena indigotica]
MPLQLLDLPGEILLICLSYLDLADIVMCLRLPNLALTRLILEAPAIQFRIEQKACAVEETVYGEARPLFERRKALKEREKRWRVFAPCHRQVVKTRRREWLRYDVGEDCYALAYGCDQDPMLGDDVKYMFLDVNDKEPVWLQAAQVTEPVIDICVVSEWDLLVVVTFSVETAGMRAIAAHLRQLSTGAVREGMAKTIDLAQVPQRYGFPDLQVEVAGSTLAIACCFGGGENDQDMLHLIHWPSGRALADTIPCSLTGFLFVHDALLLIPNSHTHCLDVLALNAGPDGNACGWMLPFRLPALRAGHRIFWHTFECRGQPNPRTHLVDLRPTPAQTRTPFRPEPEQSRIFLMFDTLTAPTDSADAYDTELRQTVVVIDRARLQECFQEAYRHLEQGAPLVEVPFADWGLRASTWLDAGPRGLGLSGYAVTGCVGTRFAALGAGADPAGPKHVRILDFNETGVARLSKQLEAARSDVLEATHATIRVQPPGAGVAQEHSVFAEPLGAALGYVDITSREAVDWKGVHLSNACILGEKDSDVDEENELHVLHFG